MTSDEPALIEPQAPQLGATTFAIDQVARWSAVVEQFIQWQVENMLRGTPSATQRQSHRQDLKWLLQLTRLVCCVAADPEFPDKSLAAQLEAQVAQLEESWEQLYNPMPAGEADHILSESFPDER